MANVGAGNREPGAEKEETIESRVEGRWSMAEGANDPKDKT